MKRGKNLKPATLALMDRCVAALLEHGAGTTGEIAEWVGTVPCFCLRTGQPCAGVCRKNGTPGWRLADMSDVRPPLEHAVRRDLAYKDTINGRVLYVIMGARTPIPDEGHYE